MKIRVNIYAGAAVVAGLFVLLTSCSMFSVRDENGADYFPTPIDLQSWTVETPVSVIDIPSLPAYSKQLATEYRADEVVRAVFRHKTEDSIISLEMFVFTSDLDAFGAASRSAFEKKAARSGEFYSSDTVCVAAKGQYMIMAESSAVYLTSQGELLKSVSFVCDRIPSGKRNLPAFLSRVYLSDIVYYRGPQKDFFNNGDSFRGDYSFEGSKIKSFWSEFNSPEAAESVFMLIAKGTLKNTITDFSKDKKLFFQDENGYSAAVQRGSSVVLCRGLGNANQALKCVSGLSGLLYP